VQDRGENERKSQQQNSAHPTNEPRLVEEALRLVMPRSSANQKACTMRYSILILVVHFTSEEILVTLHCTSPPRKHCTDTKQSKMRKHEINPNLDGGHRFPGSPAKLSVPEGAEASINGTGRDGTRGVVGIELTSS